MMLKGEKSMVKNLMCFYHVTLSLKKSRFEMMTSPLRWAHNSIPFIPSHAWYKTRRKKQIKLRKFWHGMKFLWNFRCKRRKNSRIYAHIKCQSTCLIQSRKILSHTLHLTSLSHWLQRPTIIKSVTEGIQTIVTWQSFK